MNIKILRVRHTRDRFEKPMAIVLNMPGEGMDASPEELRQLAAALVLAAADCDARPKHAADKVIEYPLTPVAPAPDPIQ